MKTLAALILTIASTSLVTLYIVGTIATNVACALNQGLEEPTGKNKPSES